MDLWRYVVLPLFSLQSSSNETEKPPPLPPALWLHFVCFTYCPLLMPVVSEQPRLGYSMCLMNQRTQQWWMWRTGEDEEDSRNEGQDGAVGSHVADVVEDEADEHEEQADQGEGRGRANHLWEWEADTQGPTNKLISASSWMNCWSRNFSWLACRVRLE